MKKGYAKLLLPIIAVVVVLAGASAFALSSRKDAYIEFSISQMLSISISSDDVSIENLIPGTADNSNEISVLVSTNSESGYTVNAVTGSLENNTSNLVRIDEEGDGLEDYFASIEPGIIVSEITENRTWGFSTDHGVTYNGIPNYTSLIPVLIKTTEDPANDEIPFLVGARADKFQTPGEYRNTVTFMAVANPIPETIATTRYMQDINDDVYASMETEKQYQLIDKRDNKKYWVSKLADGNVWMTQNLNYELTAPSTTFYPETSNTDSPYTMTVSTMREDEIARRYTSWGYYQGIIYPSNIDPDTYVENGTFDLGDGVFEPDTMLKSTEDLDADSENWHYAVGGRYLTYVPGMMNMICPKGWRLPDRNTSGDSVLEQYSIEKLVSYYQYIGAAPMYISAIPFESGQSINTSGSHNYNSAKYLTLNGTMELYSNDWSDPNKISVTSMYTGIGYNSFAAIRCVALRTSVYPFTYYFNNGTDTVFYYYEPASWGGADASIKAINMSSDVMPPLDTVGFLGWATTSDATEPEYQPGDTLITNTDTDNNLYAVWGTVETSFADAFEAAGKTKVDGEHYAMQDMTGSICAAVSVNASADLVDTRDGKIYKVAKFKRYAEGSSATCWMIEGLRLGDGVTDYELTPEDSNVVADFTLSAVSDPIESTDTVQYYVSNGNTDAAGMQVGNRYNYYTVTAGTGNAKNTSICPKGWQVPGSRNYNDDYGYYSFYELYNSYSNYSQYRTFVIEDGNWTSAKWKITDTSSSNYGKTYVEAIGNSYQYPTVNFGALRCVVKPGSASGSSIATAKVVLGSNNNLNFVYDTNEYTIGDTYTDNIGETTIQQVFDVPILASESNLPGWYDYTSGYTINISDSFHDYKPVSTAYWFAGQYGRTGTITGLANIDMSEVVNASHMFYNYRINNNATWTLDLSSWDVGNVTDMSYMFAGTYQTYSSNGSWTLDLSSWNVSNVRSMAYMFNNAGSYNYYAKTWTLNTTGWNTSNVKNMAGMFKNARNYETTSSSYRLTSFAVTGIEGWNVSNVTNMSSMFENAWKSIATWSLDLSSWNMSKVNNMLNMFQGAGYYTTTWSLDLSNWNLVSMESLFTGDYSISYMFNLAGNNATTWTLIADNWNIPNVTSVAGLFGNTGPNATTYTLSLVGWNLESVGNLGWWYYYSDPNVKHSCMFDAAGNNATSWNINLSDWTITSVAWISYLFINTGKNAITWAPNVSGWEFNGQTSLDSMFASSGSNNTSSNTVYAIDLSTWDATGVTNMASMFSGSGGSAKTYRTNFHNLNTSNNTTLYNLFLGAANSATVWDHDFVGMDVSKVTTLNSMFSGAGGSVTSWELDLTSWDVRNVTNVGMFGGGFGTTNPFTVDLSGWNLASLTTIQSPFSGVNGGNTGTFYVDMSDWDVSNATAFYGFGGGAGSNATDWTIDLSGWDISNVGSLGGIFSGAGYNAKNWKAILSDWTLKDNNLNLGGMFSGVANGSNVQKFEVVGLDGWDVSGAISTSSMFSGASTGATDWSIGDLSGWDVSGVVDMSNMFNGAGLNASSWNIGNLSGWDVSHVLTFKSMFNAGAEYATNVTFTIDGWSMTNGADLSSMFGAFCSESTTCALNLPNWNINEGVTSGMFNGAGYNTTDFSLDLHSWRGITTANRGVMPYVNSSKVENYVCNLSGWDVSNVSGSVSYSGYGSKINFTLNLSGWDTRNITSATFSGLASGATGEVKIIGLGGWTTSGFTTMDWMFAGACNAATVCEIGDLSGWDMSNVTSASGMFTSSAGNVATWSVGDLSGWQTGNITKMNTMFYGNAHNATSWYIGDISGWDVHSVTDHTDFVDQSVHSITEPSWPPSP